MDWKERSDTFNIGGLMREFAEHIERRLGELEAMVGMQPEHHAERENLQLAYLHVQEEMDHLRR